MPCDGHTVRAGGRMDEAISALIGRIYEGVQDPRAFQQSVDALLPRTGATVGLVVATGVAPGPGVGLRFHGALRPDHDEAMAEYYAGRWEHDPTYAFFMNNPHARFFDTALHRDPEIHLADPYTAWNARYVGATHWMACHATRGGHDSFGMALHLKDPAVSFDEAARALFRLLFEHFDRAHGLATRPPDVSRSEEALLVIDAEHRVRSASTTGEAVLRTADGLEVRDGVIATSAHHQQRQFDRLLQAAVHAVSRGGVGGEMLVERRSGRRPLVVIIDPLPDQAALVSFARGAIVRIIDPDQGVAASGVDRWRRLWGLTIAEARAAAALVEHQFDLRAAAQACGITYATIRTQLAAVYAKSRTGSQAELMRLLSRVAG